MLQEKSVSYLFILDFLLFDVFFQAFIVLRLKKKTRRQVDQKITSRKVMNVIACSIN